MKSWTDRAWLLSIAIVCFGQTTVDQRVPDFQQLAAIYTKNYGPYEWEIASQDSTC